MPLQAGYRPTTPEVVTLSPVLAKGHWTIAAGTRRRRYRIFCLKHSLFSYSSSGCSSLVSRTERNQQAWRKNMYPLGISVQRKGHAHAHTARWDFTDTAALLNPVSAEEVPQEAHRLNVPSVEPGQEREPEAEPCLEPSRQCGGGYPTTPRAANQSVVTVAKETVRIRKMVRPSFRGVERNHIEQPKRRLKPAGRSTGGPVLRSTNDGRSVASTACRGLFNPSCIQFDCP